MRVQRDAMVHRKRRSKLVRRKYVKCYCFQSAFGAEGVAIAAFGRRSSCSDSDCQFLNEFELPTNKRGRNFAAETDSVLTECPSRFVRRIMFIRTGPREALYSSLLCKLNDSFDDVAHDDAVRVIVPAANGLCFWSGRDLKEDKRTATMRSFNEMHGGYRGEAPETIDRVPHHVVVHAPDGLEARRLLRHSDRSIGRRRSSPHNH